MRVLIATPLYPPDPGGPATYARSLEEELPGSGIGVSLVTFGAVRYLPPGVRHVVYLFLLLKEGKQADLILALDPVSVGLPAVIAAKLLKKPLVMKVVGDYAWEQGRQRFGVTEQLDKFYEARSVAFEVRLLKRIEAWTARQAVSLIVPSDYLKRIVSQWKGVDSNRITVIYNAMRAEEGGRVPAAVTALPRPCIVSVGRLVPWKQMEGIVDAMKDTDASLVIVGDGPSCERIEQRVQATAPDRMLLTGALSHADTLATMQQADIFVLNSTYEGLSHLLIEALSLGLPIIATNVGGNPELITDAVNGLLIPSRDTSELQNALALLLTDETLRTRLAVAARESAKRFSMKSMVDATVALLQRSV